jgi:hypothetical protein
VAKVTARIQFRPGEARYWIDGATQEIIEMRFESPEALIETLREIEPAILNCTARINGKVVDLREVSKLDRPAKLPKPKWPKE